MTITWVSHSDFEYSIFVPFTTASKFNLKKFAAQLKKMQGCELIIINSISDSTNLGDPKAVIKLTLSNYIPITAYIPTILKVVDAHLKVFVAPAPIAKKRKADPLETLAARAADEAQIPVPFYLAPTVIKNARRFVFQPSVTTIPQHLFGNLNPETALGVIRNPILLGE